MVFSLICQTFATLVARLSAFHLDPQKWPSTFSPLNIWSIPTVHMWMKDLSVFSTYLLSFPSRAFWTVDPYIYIHFFFSCRVQCCPFEFHNLAVILKHSHHFINFIPLLMADPSPSFVPALMTWAFKKESLCVSNTNSFFPKKHTLSIPFSSPFSSSSQRLTPICSDQTLILWRWWKAKAPLAVKGRRSFSILPLHLM